MRSADLASPRKWIGADIECDAGCGVVPFRYREQSYVNALQWAIGLEIFLLVKDPWRVVLTTDHPERRPVHQLPAPDPPADGQAASATSSWRGCIPTWRRNCALRSITRELTLDEIAIMTRAAPARLLGLRDRGHLGVGAAADIAVYREHADREAMFATPEYVFKDGVLVARAGRIVADAGGRHAFRRARLRPRHREDAAPPLATRTAAVGFDHVAIGRDELCRCCNGGRLLPAACFEAGA